MTGVTPYRKLITVASVMIALIQHFCLNYRIKNLTKHVCVCVSVTACSDTNIQALHESYLTFQKVTVYHSAQNMLSVFLLFECLYSRRGLCLAVIRRSALDL